MIGLKDVKFLYCAPQTFYFGDNISSLAAVGLRRNIDITLVHLGKRAYESGRYMRKTMQRHVDEYWGKIG